MLHDPPRYLDLVDPRLKSDYPLKGLHQAVAVAAMCLDEDASVRPTMSDVVNTLNFVEDEDTGRKTDSGHRS